MGFEDKVDVIDLIINVLKEHEKTLDELVHRLEERVDTAPVVSEGVRAEAFKPSVSVLLRRWNEFREHCVGASIIAFDVEGKRFTVSAVKDGILHSYQEELPDMEISFREDEERAVLDGLDLRNVELIPTVLRGRLTCGLEMSMKGTRIEIPDGNILYKVIYDIDVDKAKTWLAVQFEVEEKNIFYGKISL